MALPLGLVPPRPLLPGEEDPNAIPSAGPLTTAVGEGGGGGDTAAVLAAALTPPATVDTTHNTGAQQTTHQVLPTPAATEGMASLDVAAEKRAAAESKLAAEAVKQAEMEAKVEEGKQLAAQYAAAERLRKKQEDQAVVDAAVARDMTKRQLMERASDNIGKSYWSDKSAAYRILSAFVTGLGDYAHIKAGGQGLSPASQALEEEIAKDRQHKISIFQNSEKFQKLAAEDVVKAKELMAEHLKDIDIMQSAMVNKLTGAMAVYAKRSKVPEAQAEADKASAIAAGKDAELKAKLGEHYAVAVTKTGGRQDFTHTDNNKASGKESKPTAEENTRAQRGAGIEEAVGELSKMDPRVITSALQKSKSNENRMAAADKTSQSGIGSSLLVEGLARGTDLAPSSKLHDMTDPEKRAAARADQWNTWVLHDLTGAAYSAGEKSDVTSGFTITPDDSPASARKKLDDGMAYARRLNLLSGPAAQARLGGSSPAAPQKATEKPKTMAEHKAFAVEKAEAADWLKNNPDADPAKVKRIKAKYGLR